MTDQFAVKMDSNITGLRYCEELTNQPIGTLPVAAAQVWRSLEPNSYPDFGPNTKTVARMPINPSRQIQKGVLVDMDPAGGLQNDLTQDGLTRLLQGFFFANMRESYDSQPINGLTDSITGVVGSSHTVKFNWGYNLSSIVVSATMKLSGFTNSANNGLFEVASKTLTHATGVLTGSGEPTDGDTVTIGTRVYTFQTVLTAVDGHVLIGGTEAAAFTNLTHAINGTGGVPGTDYFVTAADPLVTAADVSSAVTVTALNAGYGYNSVATTTTSSEGSWGASTLSGGVANVVMTAGLVDETPPAAARVEVVGQEGGSGDLAIVNVVGALPYMTSISLDFTTLPLIAGQWLWIGGDSAAVEFATLADNGWARIRAITAHNMSFDKTSSEMVSDNGSGKTIQLFWGKVLRNEYNPALQVRRSYTFERSLGYPDLSQPTAEQAEYLQGLVANELTVNMATAAKVELDLAFLGTNYYTIDTTGTLLSVQAGASAPALVEEDAFNTSSHISRAKMTVLSPSDAAFTDASPSSFFAEVTEFKFMVKNNLKANKALGKIGPFEMTAGFFEASGSVQAYFSEVAAIQAVRNNADVTIDFALAKSNQGVLFDLPLMTLKSKGLDVKINEPIMLPLEFTLGADKNFNTTMLTEWFDYLPNAAMPSN